MKKLLNLLALHMKAELNCASTQQSLLVFAIFSLCAKQIF